MIVPSGTCFGSVSVTKRFDPGSLKRTLPALTLRLTVLPATGSGSPSGPTGPWEPVAGDTVPGGAGASSSQRAVTVRVSPGARLSSSQSTPAPLSGASGSTV